MSRNTEGVVSITCLRHFVLHRPCSSEHLLSPTQRERERKMLWSCSQTAWLKRCSLSPATVAVLSLLAVGASTQTGTESMHSILLSLHVDRDMCFLDRAT